MARRESPPSAGRACNLESSPTISPTSRGRTSRRATRRCCAPRPSCSFRISPTTRTRSAATRNWRSISCRRCRSKCGLRSPSGSRSAPMRRRAVIRTLARDVFQVAAPVIRRSPVLDSFDLLSVIAATDVEHHRLIARRSDLGDDVKRALRLTGDAEVIGYLDHGSVHARRAGRRGREASPAGRRRPRRRRRQPRRNRFDVWPVPRPRPRRPVSGSSPTSRCGPPVPRPAATAQSAERAFQSILSAAQIVGFARNGQTGELIAAIADGLELDPDAVAACVHDHSGEGARRDAQGAPPRRASRRSRCS